MYRGMNTRSISHKQRRIVATFFVLFLCQVFILECIPGEVSLHVGVLELLGLCECVEVVGKSIVASGA